MKITTILSLTLNALLAGCVIWLACARARPENGVEASRFSPNGTARIKVQPARPPASDPWPEVVEVNEPFHWARLESTDYQIYLANLRGIGCPESTVRDIIIADVNDLFSRRIKGLVDEVQGRFWELILRQDDLKKMVEEKASQLQVLTDERDEIFTVLFGGNDPRSAESGERNAADRRQSWDELTDFLPEEKRAQLAAAKGELERALQDVCRTPDLTGIQRAARRKELETAHDQALREWLSPDEYNELRLRQSPAASLRERLAGLDLTEEEVRAVASIQFAKAEAQVALSQKEPNFKSCLAHLQPEAEARTRELLGEEHYAALQHATDSRYEPIHRVTQRLELPDATAAQAYDIRRQAEEAASRVRANKTLAAEERQVMLQAVSVETKQSLSATLGPKGFAAYEKIDGGWIQQMNTSRP